MNAATTSENGSPASKPERPAAGSGGLKWCNAQHGFSHVVGCDAWLRERDGTISSRLPVARTDGQKEHTLSRVPINRLER
jgi:hypothetical protein